MNEMKWWSWANTKKLQNEMNMNTELLICARRGGAQGENIPYYYTPPSSAPIISFFFLLISSYSHILEINSIPLQPFDAV
jgi:hypothetical protein